MLPKIKLLLFFILFYTQLNAQYVPIIEVPDEIEFAGMKLKVTSGARKILEKDIANITKNARYFQILVDRANLYFPLIDKIFDEESFPKDFKYLALQESSLVSDAVSKSNAVGYWQFKKESAVEVGLRVDNKVDERMNIISSSRGATRYLKRNNQTLNNWIYSLMSYNVGLGGSKSLIDQNYIGETKMKIDENTHWYVLRFLAHKLAFQHAIEKSAHMDSVLVEYIDGANKTLHEIAAEYNLDKERLATYNKWLKADVIPEDKIYSVIIAVSISQASAIAKAPTKLPNKEIKLKKEKFPSIGDINFEKLNSIAYTLVINGVKAILARNGDNSVKLSANGGISKDEFLKINEMKSFEEIIPGRVYYLSKKKKKALVLFHTVQYDESIWEIAQNYGITTEVIRTKNRMKKNEALVPGRVLWLRSKRPKNKEIEYKQITKKEVQIIKPIEQNATTIETNNNSTTPLDTSKYIYHTVQQGETIFGISQKYQIPTDSILTWNNLQNYSVSIGKKLIVSLKTSPKVDIITHTVVSGDTFYKISKMYSVSEEELKNWNNKSDLTLKIGEKLLIKKINP